MGNKNNNSIIEFILSMPKGVDWRFPDELGLSEKTLDCKQLVIKEVLKWQGEKSIIEVFLNPYNCEFDDRMIRRKEAQLNLGYEVSMSPIVEKEELIPSIQSIFKEEGYCFLKYNAYTMPLSSYYNKYDINHWSLILHCDDSEVTILDNTGLAPTFKKNMATIPLHLFDKSFSNTSVEVGNLTNSGKELVHWEDQFLSIVKKSVSNMLNNKSVENIDKFIKFVQNTSLGSLVNELEKIEFDINFYRRLHELWYLIITKNIIPKKYIKAEWVEELVYLCKCWSLIMGVIMKWKRQPNRNYSEKLIDYLQQTYQIEQSYYRELAKLVGERDE